jgi:hypothetical protein
MNPTLASQINRVQLAGAVLGVLGMLLCVAGGWGGGSQCFFSYLFGYIFWLGLSLGSLVIAMIHYLTGGRWGNVTRRFWEAGFMTLPLMALLFLPIFFGLTRLYPWAQAAVVAADKTLQNKAAYLNVTGFVLRMIVCFVIWMTLAFFLRKWSLQQDQTTDVTPTRKMRTLSGPGVVLYAFTVTFAFIDWVMSLEPDWYSTMFAIIICGGQILIAYAFATLLLAWFRNYAPVAGIASAEQFHQLGNLLLTFVMFWTYVMFGQFLINWSGNSPKEIIWYQHRVAGSWKWIIGILVVFHFIVPFFLLLFRASKRRLPALIVLAAIIFCAHIIAVFWLVAPALHQTGLRVTWLDFAAFAGVGGMWITTFFAILKRSEIIPRNDPRLDYAAAI